MTNKAQGERSQTETKSLRKKLLTPFLCFGVFAGVLLGTINYQHLKKTHIENTTLLGEQMCYSLLKFAEITKDQQPILQRAAQELAKTEYTELVLVTFGDEFQIKASSQKEHLESELSNTNDSLLGADILKRLPKTPGVHNFTTDEGILYSSEIIELESNHNLPSKTKVMAIVAIDTSPQNQHILRPFLTTSLILVFLILTQLIIGLIILQKEIFTPLKALHSAITHRLAGKKSVLAKFHANDEIGVAVNTYNTLITELDEMHAEQRLIFDSIPAYLWYKDDKNRILRTNKPGADSVGKTIEEIEGSKTEDLFPLEAEAYWKDDLEVINSGKPKLGYIEEYTPKGGEKKWVRTDKIPINSTNGTSILAIATDVTEMMLQRAAIESSEKRFQMAIEAAPTGMVMTDSDGKIILMNSTISKLFGWSSDELIGQKVEILVPDSARGSHKGHRDKFEKENAQRNMGHGRHLNGKRKDGSLFPIEVGLNPFTSEGQRFVMASVLDISERLASIEALRNSEDRLSLAIKGSSAGIWDWIDVNSEQEWWSPRYYELLGYENNEIEATYSNFKELLHPDDLERTTKTIENCFLRDGIFFIDYRLKQKNGEYKWFLGSGTLLRDEAGNPKRMTGSIQDIHDRKLAEEALFESKSKLELANKELSNFAYIASHDLREPLRSISSFMQLLREDYKDKLDSTAQEYINFAVVGANRLQEMIRSIHEYSLIERPQKDAESIHLPTAAKTAIQELLILAKEKNASINIQKSSARAKGHLHQIVQLFQNLITNALKFQSDKDPVIEISFETNQGKNIHGNLPQDPYFTCITVKDNGIGIDPDSHDRIFSIFQKLHTHEQFEGSGIGLSLCRKIVIAHNGFIWVESTEGSGSEFKFALPLSN